jgi:hypothetical protein
MLKNPVLAEIVLLVSRVTDIKLSEKLLTIVPYVSSTMDMSVSLLSLS